MSNAKLGFPAVFLNCSHRARPESVASVIAADIGRLLSTQPTVTVLASGGNSPGEVLQALSRHKLDWSRVIFSLTDERQVHQEHPHSNFGLLLRSLGTDVVTQARTVPLWAKTDTDVRAAVTRLDHVFGESPDFDVAILGMGYDGHTASLFAESRRCTVFSKGIAPTFVAVRPDPLPAEAPWPRITVTHTALARVRFPHLLVFGAEKQRILRASLTSDGPPLPIAVLFKKAKHSITVHTCTMSL